MALTQGIVLVCLVGVPEHGMLNIFSRSHGPPWECSPGRSGAASSDRLGLPQNRGVQNRGVRYKVLHYNTLYARVLTTLSTWPIVLHKTKAMRLSPPGT
jgi:hypothetical protein